MVNSAKQKKTNSLTNTRKTKQYQTKCRDDEQQSPQIYRRATSREDSMAADVFSRLGAGTVDPVPGGAIREYAGKVIWNHQFSLYQFICQPIWHFFTIIKI